MPEFLRWNTSFAKGQRPVTLLGFCLLCAVFNLTGCAVPPERAELFATVAHLETSVTHTPVPTPESLPTPTTAVVIAPGDTLPSPSRTSPAADATASSVASYVSTEPRGQRLDAYLSNLAAGNQFMGSVLVADGGELLLNKGYGMADIASGRSNTPQTQLRIGSLTKQFTAAAILRLQALGRLHVNDAISAYLPEYPNGDAITIHQLLTHTAGVPNYTARRDLDQVVTTPIALDDLISDIGRRAPDFPPGQRFLYSDSGYVLLTKIIEVASGQPYGDFLQEQVLEPLGMDRTGYDFLQPDLPEPATGYRLTPRGPQDAVDADSSWPSGAGALYSTTQDLFLWDQALKGDALLDEVARQMMFAPWVETGQGFSYGYGWETGTFSGRASQTHAGTIFGFGSFIARFPEDDATIIVLSNGLTMPPRQIADDLARILFNSNSE